jgi:hypothetical protein
LVLYKDFFLVIAVMGAAEMFVEINAFHASGDHAGSYVNAIAVENLLTARCRLVAGWLHARRLKGRSRAAVGGRLGRGDE